MISKNDLEIKIKQISGLMFDTDIIDKYYSNIDTGYVYIIKNLANEGIVNYNRKPKPRYYSKEALIDIYYKAIGVEILQGHRNNIYKEYKRPVGIVFGSRLINKRVDVYIFINPKEEIIINGLNTGIINSFSLHAISNMIDLKKYVKVMSIKEIRSIDIVNNSVRGIGNLYVEKFI